MPEMYNLKNVKTNEEIALKFFEIERNILSILEFRDLFEKLLTLIEEKFGIPHVWLSLISGNDVSRLIADLESSEILKERLNLISRKTFSKIVTEKNPVLVNDNLKPFFKLLPKSRKYFVKSLAVSPLFLEDKIIGSLNLGDYSVSRFQPNMDVLFLSQLAVKISICLANITARKQMNHLAATREHIATRFNKREMTNALSRKLSEYKNGAPPFALLVIDCDDFQKVNEAFGCNCANLYLSHIADQIMKLVATDDTVFKLSGDEYAILISHHTSQDSIKTLERYRNAFETHPMKFEDKNISVSVSCSIVSSDYPGIKDPVTLLCKADEKLYEDKKKKSLVTDTMSCQAN